MSLNFLIAPDFSPERFAGWHMFNTMLQKRADIAMHLLTPASHVEQEDMIEEHDVGLIYANPFDAAKLIREDGYLPLVRPIGKSDEMVIVSSAQGDIKTMDDISQTPSVAMADNRDVKLIGLRLLEAVDVTEENMSFEVTENYQAAARHVIQDKVDLGFFIQETFASLSKLTKMQLNVLIESDLATITHVVLVKEDMTDTDKLKEVLLSLVDDEQGRAVLSELGMEQGFEPLSEDEAEFMIDLMDTLT